MRDAARETSAEGQSDSWRRHRLSQVVGKAGWSVIPAPDIPIDSPEPFLNSRPHGLLLASAGDNGTVRIPPDEGQIATWRRVASESDGRGAFRDDARVPEPHTARRPSGNQSRRRSAPTTRRGPSRRLVKNRAAGSSPCPAEH